MFNCVQQTTSQYSSIIIIHILYESESTNISTSTTYMLTEHVLNKHALSWECVCVDIHIDV